MKSWVSKMKDFSERLHVAYYALTKKEYYFAGISSRKSGYSDSVCYYNTLDTASCHPFLSAVSEDATNIIKEM